MPLPRGERDRTKRGPMQEEECLRGTQQHNTTNTTERGNQRDSSKMANAVPQLLYSLMPRGLLGGGAALRVPRTEPLHVWGQRHQSLHECVSSEGPLHGPFYSSACRDLLVLTRVHKESSSSQWKELQGLLNKMQCTARPAHPGGLLAGVDPGAELCKGPETPILVAGATCSSPSNVLTGGQGDKGSPPESSHVT